MIVTLIPSVTSALAALMPSNVPGTLTTITSGSYFASAMPFFHISSLVLPQVCTWNSCTASYASASFASSVSAAMLHSLPSLSRMIGLVVTPRRCRRAATAHSLAGGVKRRFPE